MTDKRRMITLLAVSPNKPFRPVTVILEDSGLESVEWLVSKAEEILSKVPGNVPMKVRVRGFIRVPFVRSAVAARVAAAHAHSRSRTRGHKGGFPGTFPSCPRMCV